MYESKNLTLDLEKWPEFPRFFKPFKPFRITRDLTIMPGATLRIEKNVEIHVWPNVRILVLGDLVVDGSLWQPIRFLPINRTEVLQEEGKIGTRYKRSYLQWDENGKVRMRMKRSSPVKRLRHRILNADYKFAEHIRKKRR